MPIRPTGKVHHEILRQIATFLIPLAIIVGCVYYGSWGTLWVTLPIGLLIGRKMDESLEADIAKTQARDDSIDRGRYRAVQILSAHLGIPRDEITLEMIIKMARDCEWFEQKAKAREAHEAAEAQARRDLSRRQKSTLVAKTNRSSKTAITTFAATATATAAVTAATSATEASDADDDRYWRDSYDSYPSINPTSGLPMAPGGLMIDVGGNAFGTGGFDY